MPEVSHDSKVTLILVGVLGFLAIVLMGFRLQMRRKRGQEFNLSDYLTMAAIFCMIGRTAFTVVVLVWQNNNISATYRAQHVFTEEEIYRREIGGKLTLVNRAVYNTYIWIQKGVVLLLYKRMLFGLAWPERLIKVYWVILLVTLVPVQVTCFTECHPLSLYWQVVPNPGTCSTAVVQLYVLVALNVFTDLMLIALPMPWLFRIKRSLRQRLQLIGLFSIGFGLVIIAICRLPIYGSSTSQVNRNTLGSIEGFFAAFVANVPTLVTLRRESRAGSTTKGSAGNSGGSGSDGLRGWYGRDRFRQMASSSVEDNTILVTRDFEMTMQNGPHDASDMPQPARNSEDELIARITDPPNKYNLRDKV